MIMRDHKGRFVKGHVVPRELRGKIGSGIKNKINQKKLKVLENKKIREYKKQIALEKRAKILAEQKLTKRYRTQDGRKRMSEAKKGSKNPRWRGGVTPEIHKHRVGEKYQEWRTAVLKRDNYACTGCSSKEKLHVHHIKPFREYPELRLEASNGTTLCVPCHMKRSEE